MTSASHPSRSFQLTPAPSSQNTHCLDSSISFSCLGLEAWVQMPCPSTLIGIPPWGIEWHGFLISVWWSYSALAPLYTTLGQQESQTLLWTILCQQGTYNLECKQTLPQSQAPFLQTSFSTFYTGPSRPLLFSVSPRATSSLQLCLRKCWNQHQPWGSPADGLHWVQHAWCPYRKDGLLKSRLLSKNQ